MRSACLRNARSPASATSPLLPFLAPRAFAEAQFYRRQDDINPSKEQEDKNRTVRCGTPAWKSKGGAALGARYTDIFCFTRQQLRSFSTEASDSVPDPTGWDGSDIILGGPIDSRPKHAQGRNKRIAARSGIRKGASSSSKDVQHFTRCLDPVPENMSKRLARLKNISVSETRRTKRLASLRESFEAFQRYEIPKLRDQNIPKVMDGRYRSLRRRLLAHSTRQAHILSLDKPLNRRGKHIAMAFAALDRNVYARLHRRAYPIILEHMPNCASWTASLFSSGPATGPDEVWTNWNAFDKETVQKYWPHLLIYLLDKFPHRVQRFLHALVHGPCVESLDPCIIADALEHMARGHLNESWKSTDQEELSQQSRDQFIPTFHHILHKYLAPHTHVCSQDLLYCVAKLADTKDFQRTFDLMKESDTYIGHHVLLHYANAFAEAGEFRQALACLRTIAEGATNAEARARIVNEMRFRWSCALTLHRSMKKENYHETTGIVATLVDFGVKLDILLYNVIIRNAMEAGDIDTAFKVYNTLDENGLQPDKITFSTLLHGCTVTPDPSKFSDFADYCAETAKETKDPWLATDYLYYQFVCLHRVSQNTEVLLARSQHLLQTYLRYFSPRSLEPFWATSSRSLRTISQSTPDDALSESAFMEPPPLAVYIMLQLEILRASSNKDRIWNLYQKFLSLVQNNHDSALSKLAKQPIIWNAFLLSFCRSQHFEHASQLVRDISDHGLQANVFTWNIFMQGFFKTQQLNAAERVYEIMRSRGIEPDQFTYQVMLRGYARAQQVPKVGEILEHVEQGEQMDPKLLRDLSRLHDQQKVVYELEKARLRREQKKEMEAKAKEDREKLRWAPPKFDSMIKPNMDNEHGLAFKSTLKPGYKPYRRTEDGSK